LNQFAIYKSTSNASRTIAYLEGVEKYYFNTYCRNY